MQIRRPLVGALALAFAFALEAPTMAQEGQLSDSGSSYVTGCDEAPPPCQNPVPPSDTTGIAPVAKVTASWPRVTKVNLKATARAASQGPTPSAMSAPGVLTPEGTYMESISNTLQHALYKSTAQPRPGQIVTLTGLESTDVDAEDDQKLTYEWRIVVNDVGGQYASATPITSTDAVVPVQTNANTTAILATLLVTDADGNKAASKINVPVSANVAPQITFDRQKKISRCGIKNGSTTNKKYYSVDSTKPPQVSFIPLPAAPGPQISPAALQKIVADNEFTLHANGCDPDGEIVRYEFARVQWKYPEVDSGKPTVAEPGQFAPANPANGAQAFFQTTVPTADLKTFYSQTGDGTTNSTLVDAEVTFAVRAYDDEGAFSEALTTVRVAPNCAKGVQTMGGGLLRVEGVGGCVAPIEKLTKDGKPATNALQIRQERIKVSASGVVRVNGVEFLVDVTQIDKSQVGEIVWIPQPKAERSGYVKFGRAAVTTRSKDGVTLDLPSGKLEWKFDEAGAITNVNPPGVVTPGFTWSGGTLAGLPLVNAEKPTMFTLKNGKLTPKFQASLTTKTPAEFTRGAGDAETPEAFSASASGPQSNAATAAEPVTFWSSADGSARIASATATAAKTVINVPNLNVGGVEIEKAKLVFDGDDNWAISGTVRLGEPMAMPNTSLAASASIRDGRLGHLDGTATFGNGILLGNTGIYMTKIRFTLDFGAGVPTACVPDIGSKFVSYQPVREAFELFGFGKGATRDARLANLKATFIPDYTYDYGVPAFQVCGTVGFRTFPILVPGKGNVPLAQGDISLGYADYADRDSVFRILGKPIKVLSFPGHIKFEVYSDGYASLEAGLKADLGPVSARGDVKFEASIPQKKFNAGAYAEVCIDVADVGCASATYLLSSKGVGACFELDVLFFELSAGGTFEFKNADIDGYLDGCTVKDVEEHISGKGNVKVIVHKSARGVPEPSIRRVPPAGSRARTVFARTASTYDTRVEPGETVSFDVPKPDGVAKARAAQAGFTVPSRTIGATFMIKGAGGLVGFDIIKPDGTVLTSVDDQPKVGDRIFEPLTPPDAKMMRANNFKAVKDQKHAVTNVVVAYPTAGRWQVRIKEGARAATNVRIAITGPKPRMQVARGAKPQRSSDGRFSLPLSFVDQRDGIVAHVYERGGTGIQKIGEVPVPATGTVSKQLSFLPIGWKKEPRTVIAFFERYGYPVGMSRPIAFTAPPTPPAPPATGVRASARAKTTTIRWDPIKGVRRYEILITVNDGRRLSYSAPPNRTSITVPIQFERHDAMKVAVRALSRRGRPGPSGTDSIAARATRPRPTLSTAQRRALARAAAVG